MHDHLKGFSKWQIPYLIAYAVGFRVGKLTKGKRMRKIRTDTEMIIQGRDARALVRGLREASRDPSDTTQHFMDNVASRVAAQTGKEIRTTTPAAFIEDLIEVGHIWEITDGVEAVKVKELAS